MADESPDRDPEIRKRAAWLLGMLALVAALFVTLMVTFFNTSGGSEDNNAGPTEAPVSTAAGTTSGTTTRPTSRPAPSSGGSDATSPTGTGTSGTGGSTSAAGGTVSCPSDEPCALESDVGNAVAAINAYRTANGRDAVPGSVSEAAKKCALSNGSDCSGGWAETQVPAKNGRPDGAVAVQKIKSLGKLLTDMDAIEIGWAYDPGAKQFYFAIVRQD